MESCEFNPHTFPPQYSDSIEYEEKKDGDDFKKFNLGGKLNNTKKVFKVIPKTRYLKEMSL